MSDTALLTEIHQIEQSAVPLLGAAELEEQIKGVAESMDQQLFGTNPIFLCVLMGGVVYFSKLISCLRMPMMLDYIHVSRYHGQTDGRQSISWIAEPVHDMHDRTVVIVDDIFDKGLTMAAVKQYCQRRGAARVLSSVLINKKVDRLTDDLAAADYAAVDIGNEFVFGYGLDYKNYLRNMPGIYTLPA